MEEIVILDEQKRRHPLTEVTQVLGLEELREMQAAIKEVYVDQAVAEFAGQPSWQAISIAVSP